LSWAIGLILKKLVELLRLSVWEASSVQYIVCRLGDVVKSITSMFKKLLKSVWKGVGVLRPGSTYPYSETPGEHSREKDALYDFKNKQHETAMKAPIDDPSDRMRKAGL